MKCVRELSPEEKNQTDQTVSGHFNLFLLYTVVTVNVL